MTTIKFNDTEIAYWFKHRVQEAYKARGLAFDPNYARRTGKKDITTTLDPDMLAMLLSRLPSGTRYKVLEDSIN